MHRMWCGSYVNLAHVYLCMHDARLQGLESGRFVGGLAVWLLLVSGA